MRFSLSEALPQDQGIWKRCALNAPARFAGGSLGGKAPEARFARALSQPSPMGEGFSLALTNQLAFTVGGGFCCGIGQKLGFEAVTACRVHGFTAENGIDERLKLDAVGRAVAF